MLYPPILASTQPVFSLNSIPNGYIVNFDLASITEADEIGNVSILVAKQSNNKSIVNTSQYPDGIIYHSYTPNENTAIILSSELASPQWEAGCLYKIQLRFGYSKIRSISNNTVVVIQNGQEVSIPFQEWHRDQVERNQFSEWSTVLIVKPIHSPTLEFIPQNGIFSFNSTGTSRHLVTSLTPTFFAGCTFQDEDKEIEKYYQFSIYQEDKLLETTGQLFHKSGEVDVGQFETLLQNRGSYNVKYQIWSNNGYTAELASAFVATSSTIGDLENLEIEAIENAEDGCIELHLKGSAAQQLTGNFIITRASNLTNFTRYEDLYFLNCINEDYSINSLCYTDYTIESGVTYRYGLQQFVQKNLRSNMKLSEKVMVDFEYSYLYGDGVQLQLRFNQKLSSFKHTTLRSKQDTLGDKYPYLIQNGNAYYAEFPVAGLISFHENTEAFLHSKSDGMYYQDKLVIPREKFKAEIIGKTYLEAPISQEETLSHKTRYSYHDENYADKNDIIASEDYRTKTIETTNSNSSNSSTQNTSYSTDYTISTDLEYDNIYVERKFREAVESFLNNFHAKLYKSPTEGNIIINLMNISFSPEESLGRMIYSFSATAYEIAENTLKNLDSYNIISIGTGDYYQNISQTYEAFGQVTYWPGRENGLTIYQKIAALESKQESDYTISLEHLNSIWVEHYPKASIEATIVEQQAKQGYHDAYLDTALALPDSAPINLEIGLVDSSSRTRVVVSPHRIYTLTEDINDLVNISYYNNPIIVNYICTISINWNSNDIQSVSGIDSITGFHQVAGLFSTDPAELIGYNVSYESSADLAIAKIGNYTVYKTKDILDVIKESIRHEIEETKGPLTIISDKAWKDGQGNEYYFNGLTSVNIEADTGTIVKIGASETQYNSYVIGYNGDVPLRFNATKIFFEDIFEHGDYLVFGNNTSVFALVNFTYFMEIRAVG